MRSPDEEEEVKPVEEPAEVQGDDSTKPKDPPPTPPGGGSQ